MSDQDVLVKKVLEKVPELVRYVSDSDQEPASAMDPAVGIGPRAEINPEARPIDRPPPARGTGAWKDNPLVKEHRPLVTFTNKHVVRPFNTFLFGGYVTHPLRQDESYFPGILSIFNVGGAIGTKLGVPGFGEDDAIEFVDPRGGFFMPEHPLRVWGEGKPKVILRVRTQPIAHALADPFIASQGIKTALQATKVGRELAQGARVMADGLKGTGSALKTATKETMPQIRAAAKNAGAKIGKQLALLERPMIGEGAAAREVGAIINPAPEIAKLGPKAVEAYRGMVEAGRRKWGVGFDFMEGFVANRASEVMAGVAKPFHLGESTVGDDAAAIRNWFATMFGTKRTRWGDAYPDALQDLNASLEMARLDAAPAMETMKDLSPQAQKALSRYLRPLEAGQEPVKPTVGQLKADVSPEQIEMVDRYRDTLRAQGEELVDLKMLGPETQALYEGNWYPRKVAEDAEFFKPRALEPGARGKSLAAEPIHFAKDTHGALVGISKAEARTLMKGVGEAPPPKDFVPHSAETAAAFDTHVTLKRNLKNIRKEGLKADEAGDVYLWRGGETDAQAMYEVGRYRDMDAADNLFRKKYGREPTMEESRAFEDVLRESGELDDVIIGVERGAVGEGIIDTAVRGGAEEAAFKVKGDIPPEKLWYFDDEANGWRRLVEAPPPGAARMFPDQPEWYDDWAELWYKHQDEHAKYAQGLKKAGKEGIYPAEAQLAELRSKMYLAMHQGTAPDAALLRILREVDELPEIANARAAAAGGGRPLTRARIEKELRQIIEEANPARKAFNEARKTGTVKPPPLTRPAPPLGAAKASPQEWWDTLSKGERRYAAKTQRAWDNLNAKQRAEVTKAFDDLEPFDPEIGFDRPLLDDLSTTTKHTKRGKRWITKPDGTKEQVSAVSKRTLVQFRTAAERDEFLRRMRQAGYKDKVISKWAPKTEEELAEAGEILNPARNIYEALASNEQRLAKGRLFKTVSEDSRMALPVDEAPEGWRALNHPKWGLLNGKAVHPDIYRDLMGVDKTILSDGQKIIRHFVANFKAAKTIWSFKTHVRNFFGNVAFSHIAGNTAPWGGGFHNAGWYKQAFTELTQRKGPIYREMVKRGIVGTQFSDAEIQAFTKLFEPLANAAQTPKGMARALREVFVRLPYAQKSFLIHGKPAEFLGKFYNFGDTWYRAATYLKYKGKPGPWWWSGKGMTSEEAVAQVNKFFQNYAEVGTGVKRLRESPVGGPFATFGAESLRILRNGIRERPIRTATTLIAPWVFNRALKATMGISDEEYELLTRDGPLGIISPYRNDDGNHETFPLGYWHPFGNILNPFFTDRFAERREQVFGPYANFFFEATRPFLFQNPAVTIPIAGIGMFTDPEGEGMDPFTGQPIAERGDTPGQRIGAFGHHAARQLLPGMTPKVGREAEKIEDLLRGRNLSSGKPRTTGKTILDTAFGVNLYEMDPKVEGRRLQGLIKGIDKQEREDINSLKWRYKKGQITRDEYVEKVKSKQEEYRRRRLAAMMRLKLAQAVIQQRSKKRR